MKKNIKFIIKILFIIAILFLVIYFVINLNNKIRKDNINNQEWLNNHIEITDNKELGVKYTKTKKYVNIFNQKYQNVVDSKINELLENNDYTFDNPLIIYNPYGINSLSFNIYFNDSNVDSLKYNIDVEGEEISTFEKDLEVKDNKYYQLIGLVPGYINNITIIKTYDKEDYTFNFSIDLTNIKILSETKISVEYGDSDSKLTDGLYTVLGNDSDDQDYVSMYDNDGIIRSEITIIGYRAHSILFKDDKMYFSISQTKIAEINNLGMITNIYRTGKYYLHHDYTFDDDGNLLVLANNTNKNTEEDCIIKIDLKTKEVTEVIDFENMFKSYVETCTLDTTSARDEGEDGLDWLHLNSIEYVDKDVILSSRETSSIIKIKNIESNPELVYILADEKIWQDTDFSEFVYKKIGDFKIHAGQHSVRYSSTSDKDIYYLTLYDNNYGKANSQPNFDYSTIGIDNDNAFTGDNSYYYVYKVNEKEKTFELVDYFPIEYSGIVSSVQTMNNGNIIIDSGTKGIFSEYDENHNLIRKYTVKLNKYMAYRVLKYDFNGFWFK